MSGTVPDVIDALVGIQPGSALAAIRLQRAQARDNAQLSYLSLFKPDSPGDMPLRDRYAVAVFVAGLHGQTQVEAFYRDGLAEFEGGAALAELLTAEIALGAATGPYGHYPAGPLSAEDQPGETYRVGDANLGKPLAAALEHAHLLVFHPRDAAPPALQALLDAGWTTTGIVTLSQLIAFLSFQVRVVTGLRVLAA
jgi:CMD domain protein